MSLNDFIGPAIGGAIVLLITLMGWIWQLANKTAQVEFLDRRMTALEAANNARGARIDEIADRLARIEPSIAFAVDYLKITRRLAGAAD